MPETTQDSRVFHRHHPAVLVNDAALKLPEVCDLQAGGNTVIVAGSQLAAMTLAGLALPGAQMIWTDFRQSRSLGQLHREITARGGLDQLILAADGGRAESTFSVMCAILSLLPALRRRPQARIMLALDDGPAVAGLEEFLARLAPRLLRQNITIDLRITQSAAG